MTHHAFLPQGMVELRALEKVVVEPIKVGICTNSSRLFSLKTKTNSKWIDKVNFSTEYYTKPLGYKSRCKEKMVNPYMSIWVSLKCCSTSSYHWPLADLLTHPIDVSSLGVCCTDKGSHAGATHHVYRYTYKKSIHDWDTSDVNSRFRIFGYCNCLGSQGIESQNIRRKEIKAVTERMHNFF